jgi:hypothetical protein
MMGVSSHFSILLISGASGVDRLVAVYLRIGAVHLQWGCGAFPRLL